MIQVLLLNEGKALQGGEELLERPGLKWIDVLKPTPPVLEALGQRYGLHRLAIEDCLQLDQRPKIEDYPNHQFVVHQGFTADSEDLCELTMHEHHFFVGKEWIISVHELPFEGFESTRKRLMEEPQLFGRGVDVVLCLLMDSLVDANFPVLDRFDDELEDLESAVFEEPRPEQVQRIFALKRSLSTMRRVLSPQRDVVGLMAKRGISLIGEQTALYFRDIYDHLVRLYEQIDAARDLLGNVMDGYLSVVANRTNDINKQLTIFATIFLPLSFITGFFGQNFDFLSSRASAELMFASMILIPLGLVIWFKRKHWW